ncbi:DUF1295 domain-containing protein [Gordonia sp. HY442]|uniref:DUF1295 domain-containing protein n=1 Tax=Gordonia zhenghanii TaxID=2911516 RepID=UPI001F19DAA5|nr:DUF1295 domain-containing protein [Gordonia zhenghanii]MCF8606824.1 DUF1295 domain-containing protein [Gordonia zhenghanii]
MTGVGAGLVVLGVSVVWIAVLQSAGLVIGRRIGRWNVVDVIWGVGFVGIGLIAAVLGGGDLVRRVTIAVIIAVWGLRLSWHMHVKTRGQGEDPRYSEFLGPAPGLATVARRVFATQGVSQIWVGLPVIVSAVSRPTSGGWWALFVFGVLASVAGLVIEALGDAQLRAYRLDPQRGPVMDRGLWAWTRHPNYFGDACLWWGVWAIAASGGPALFTVFSPIAMTYFLVHATGARRLERMMARRPAYVEYQRRTSFFVPWPPRRTR